MSLRIVFMGTPDFAVPTLSEIVGQGHDVIAVYTRPPAAAGRGMPAPYAAWTCFATGLNSAIVHRNRRWDPRRTGQ